MKEEISKFGILNSLLDINKRNTFLLASALFKFYVPIKTYYH